MCLFLQLGTFVINNLWEKSIHEIFLGGLIAASNSSASKIICMQSYKSFWDFHPVFTQVSYERGKQLLSALWHVDLSHQDSVLHMCFTGHSFGLSWRHRTGRLPWGRRRAESSQAGKVIGLKKWCETVVNGFLFWLSHFHFSLYEYFLLSIKCLFNCHPTDWFRSGAFHLLSLSPPLSVDPVFFSNIMIHWLWSLWAVSLKSVCLLSATTDWYIISITCNFLGFIRYIYSPLRWQRPFFSATEFKLSGAFMDTITCQNCAAGNNSKPRFSSQVHGGVEFKTLKWPKMIITVFSRGTLTNSMVECRKSLQTLFELTFSPI